MLERDRHSNSEDSPRTGSSTQESANPEVLNLLRTLFSGVENQLKQEYRALIPVVGWMARQSKALENYYRFSPPDSPLGSLLTTLFYRNEGVEFEPSKKPNQVVKYLTPYSIGVLAGYLAAHRAGIAPAVPAEMIVDLICRDVSFSSAIKAQGNVFRNAQDLAKEAICIFRGSQDEIAALNHQISEGRIKYKECSARRMSLADRAVQSAPEDLRTKLLAVKKLKDPSLAGCDVRRASSEAERDELTAYNIQQELRRKAVVEERRVLTEMAVAVAGTEVNREYQLLGARMQEYQEFENNCDQKISAIRECASERIKATWTDNECDRQALAKQIKFNRAGRYFDQYITSLASTFSPEGAIENSLPKLVSSIALCAREGPNSVHAELAGVTLMTLLSYKIKDSQDKFSYIRGLRDVCPDVIDAGHSNSSMAGAVEDAALTIFRIARLESPIPPLASTRFVNVQIDEAPICYPDCGETTLRSFFNLFLYDRDSQKYDVERLQALNLPVSPAVISFYKKYPNVSETCTQQAHDDWAKITCGLGTGVQYLLPFDGPCAELKPGAQNMTAVLKALIGTDDVAALAQEVVRVSKSIDRVDIAEFDKDDQTEDFKNKITLHIGGTSVEWHFLKRHFRMYEKTTTSQLNKATFQTAGCYELIGEHLGSIGALTVLSPFIRRHLTSAVQTLPFFSDLRSGAALYSLVSARLDWVEDIEALGRCAIRDSRLVNDPEARAFLTKMLLSIPNFDGHEEKRERIASEIEQNKIGELAELATLLRSGAYLADGGLAQHRKIN